MPKREYGVSDLGEAEDRVRGALALEGRIPLDVGSLNILPVVIVNDGTRPGMARRRDRRFMHGIFDLVSGQTCGWFCNAPDGVVIEHVVLATSVPGTGFTIQQLFLGAGSAGVITLNVLGGKMLDRGRGEPSPMLAGNTGAVLPAVDMEYGLLNGAQGFDTKIIPLNFFMEFSAALYFRGVAQTTGEFSAAIFGRTF